MSKVFSVKLIESRTHHLDARALREDSHAAKYTGVFEAHRDAFEHLLAILNDPRAEQLMVHESTQGPVRFLLPHHR